MNRPQTPSPSSTSLQSHAHSRAKKLTKEQRIEKLVGENSGPRRLQLTKDRATTPSDLHQARYAANAVHLSPKKSSGRPLVLSSEQVDEIDAFVTSSPEHRQLTYFELAYAYFSHFGVSEKVIQCAMSRRGYARRIAASKPPLSAENKRKRLEFAAEHLHWNKEDWMRVFWTDETWIYYQRQQANRKNWRRDNDQVVSAIRLFEELGHKYSHEAFTTANLRALAIYIHASIPNLAQNTKEIAIDATFGTNNTLMDFFDVLAEFDGTGTPLTYLFVQKLVPAEAGPMTQVLVRFMEKIRFLGLDPSFV
ncbi:hypothetical protein K3495_g6344 [Podosphaera aphanis]|nr:hypothetical protein K3495_g6344 [Podosphaera aphanis]